MIEGMPGRWIAVLACVAVAGCGSEPRLAAGTADRLHGAVEEARTTAADGDRDGALQALDRLERRIDAAETDGELSNAEAAELRRGAGRARRQVRREIQPPAPPAATAEPEPTPTATLPEEDAGEEAAPPGPGKGKGKAKGPKPGKGKKD
jgi:hypothetical protein